MFEDRLVKMEILVSKFELARWKEARKYLDENVENDDPEITKECLKMAQRMKGIAFGLVMCEMDKATK